MVEQSESAKAAEAATKQLEAVKQCSWLKDKYDRCFNNWYRGSFLNGHMSNACDDYFDDYKACIMESTEGKYGKMAEVISSDAFINPKPNDQRSGMSSGGARNGPNSPDGKSSCPAA